MFPLILVQMDPTEVFWFGSHFFKQAKTVAYRCQNGVGESALGI